jgi:hypothetical protein
MHHLQGVLLLYQSYMPVKVHYEPYGDICCVVTSAVLRELACNFSITGELPEEDALSHRNMYELFLRTIKY